MKQHIAALAALLICGWAGELMAAKAVSPAPKITPKTPAEIPLSAFAKPALFSSMKLSPAGNQLAGIYSIGTEQRIATLSLPDFKLGRPLQAGTDGSIENFWWSGPDRLVVALATFQPWDEAPRGTGELVALNADGSKPRYLYGYQNPTRSDQQSAAYMQDAHIGLPNQVLVSALPYGRAYYTTRARALLLDSSNGYQRSLATAPIVGPADFTADAQGQLRFVSNLDGSYDNPSFFSFDATARDWKPLPEVVQRPLLGIERISSDGRIWVTAKGSEGGACLMEYLEKEAALKPVRCGDGTFGIGSIVYSSRTRLPIATVDWNGKPRLKPLDFDARWKALITALQKAAGDALPIIADISPDDRTAVVWMGSDRDPGGYYLFDTQSGNLQFLVAAHEDIDPELMSERRPIQFKARDGTELHGFLTLPRGKEAHDLPLVVNPHGGPFGISDDWLWDGEAQMLASRGYAVLQVNFRGSGGRGQAFIEAGYGQWHSLMIDDITDGVRWATQQGFAAKDRICIYGGSYGGYAAMMSAVREPDLYRCVIASAGVYDLKLFRDGRILGGGSDISSSALGRSYIEDAIGADTAKLIEASPLTYIDQLKAPVMIVHGKRDERVPFNQAETLRKAMQARKLPYEWLIKTTEGHGFVKPENREELYTKMLQFLDQHIGGAPLAANTPAPAAP